MNNLLPPTPKLNVNSPGASLLQDNIAKLPAFQQFKQSQIPVVAKPVATPSPVKTPTPIQNNNQNITPVSGGLDQDIINIAKAIRQVETGNRPVKGASGEMASRYQYLPSTWKATAKQYLGDENAPLTLQNENKATYLKLKDWKDKGYNVGQIASTWNSGSPDHYNDNWRGTNSAGVAYDTPAYAKKVAAEYQRLKKENPPVVPEVKNADGQILTPNQAANQTIEQASGAPESPLESLFDGVNKIIGGVQDAIGWTGIPKVVGNVVGTLGQGIGAVEGAILNPITNITKGKPLFEGEKEAISSLSQKVGQFGQTIGEEGTKAAPLAGLGKIPSAVIAAGQLYEGGKSLISGDYEKAVPELALGALGAYGVKGSKGLIFDQPIGKVADMTLTGGKKGVDELVNTIAQGKVADVAKAKSALSTLDVSGIKNYEEFAPVINTRIKNLAEGQDKLLEADTNFYRTPQLDKTTKVGNTSITTNYVKEALADLEHHYSISADYVNAEKIAQYSKKLEETGLEAKDINNIARIYGSEFSSNAFKIDGTIKSGVSASKAENIRTGVKTTSRTIFDNEALQALDTEMSNLYRLRDLTNKMTERVNRAEAKLTTPTMIEKVADKLIQIADVTTLGSVKGVAKTLLSRLGVQEKSLNAVQLEAALSKNLKMLDKLNSATKEADILSSLDEIIAQVKKDKSFTAAGLLPAGPEKGSPTNPLITPLTDKSGPLPQPNIPYAQQEVSGLLEAPKGQQNVSPQPLITPIPEKAMTPKEITPKIEKPTIVVEGEVITAADHGKAIKKAEELGLDTSKIVRERDGKFLTTDGRLLNREEAIKEFGIDHSHDIKNQESSKGSITPKTLIGTGITLGLGLTASSLLAGKKQSQDLITPVKQESPEIKVDKIPTPKFSENKIPTLANTPIDKIELPKETPISIKSLSITDGNQTWNIEGEDKMKIANRIKYITDKINPSYTNYLLKLANFEGVYDDKQTNKNSDGSVDRGIFQINSKAFPQITSEMANDLDFSILWAISLIDAGKQHKWVANDKSKVSKITLN